MCPRMYGVVNKDGNLAYNTKQALPTTDFWRAIPTHALMFRRLFFRKRCLVLQASL